MFLPFLVTHSCSVFRPFAQVFPEQRRARLRRWRLAPVLRAAERLRRYRGRGGLQRGGADDADAGVPQKRKWRRPEKIRLTECVVVLLECVFPPYGCC